MNIAASTPLVSIVVPVYNVENYLERCVLSITRQSYTNLEIILVNDGSTDSSGSLCDKLASTDRRITVLHSKNRGLAGARNLGLTRIHGEWIVFVDSDDFIGENHITNLLSAALKSDSLIAVTGYQKVPSTKKLQEIIPVDSDLYKIMDAEQACFIALCPRETIFSPSAWAKIYHVSLAPLLNYPLGRYYEDHFTTYYVFAQAQHITYEKANDYYYTDDREGSIMHRCDERIIDLIDGDKKLLIFSREHGMKLVEQEVTKHYFSHLIGVYARAIINDQPAVAEKVLAQIKAARFQAWLSPYASVSTKLAMALSLLPKQLFNAVLRHTESKQR